MVTNDKIFLGLEKDKVVVFADILGFSQKVRDITLYQDDITSNSKTEGCICNFCEIYKAITEVDNSKQIQINRDYKFLWVSDSIVLISEYEKIGFLLDRIANMSRLMTTFGMLLRGGISCGDVHCTDNVVGVPYIEAVELEKKANYPRIIIQKDKYIQIEKYLCDEYEFIKEFFKTTENENYLEFDFVEYNINGGLSRKFSAITLDGYVSIFNNEMDCYVKTNEKNKKIVEKYAWLGKKLFSITEKHKKDYDTNKDEMCIFKDSQHILDTIAQYKVIDFYNNYT